MFSARARSNNETFKGGLFVQKFSSRLTWLFKLTLMIRTLVLICAPVWRSRLNWPEGSSYFCEGEQFDALRGPNLKGNSSVSMKARQRI